MKASYFYSETGEFIRCKLCPHLCNLSSGSFGACRVRGNKNGIALIPFYGYVTALAVDPIEKKPLYHFRPGSKILSVGFAGCNFRCPFCQNWRISQSNDPPGSRMSPGDLISAALRGDNLAISYTYSEPLVHIEFLLDCMTLAHRHGIANVLVTNGCINENAANDVLSLTDAANIDLKCFSNESYSQVLQGNLEATLKFIQLARKKKVHVEITTLIVPGFNDSADELDLNAGFIKSLNEEPDVPEVPWHLSAYHPNYQWNTPPTDPEFIIKIKKMAEGKLPYVYAGNIPDEKNDTYCLQCKALLIKRRGFQTDLSGLTQPSNGEKFFRCTKCNSKTSIIYL